ncbi:MAG: mechanosensitive ion channel family protein [Thermodesulfobacteriota bacterium]
MSLVKNEGVASVLGDALFTVIILAFFFLLLRLSRRLFKRLQKALDSWCGTRIPPIKIQDFELISAERLTAALKWLADKGKIVSYLLLFYIFIPIFFSYFPQTRHFVLGYLDYFLAPFKTIFHGIVSFIPNLIFIAVTFYVVRYFLKLLQMIFSEIQSGRVSFPGFHRDWAQPTYKLSRFLVIVIAIVMVSPYLPGFGSPAFQGLSVFFGILLSLGSTAAIANIVAGAALTYMRPFKIGDRVKIADTMGDVLEKSLLVTRIRTIKNVEVTIPNSMVLGSHMINFSAEAQARRLILYTAVTIGYDAPWRQVHELLTAAALATDGIEKEPGPFVLQTSLNDFSVTYELNVYTGNAQEILRIQSELHAQIQDKFNDAGVEIMSPTYSALRDGNQVTIPEDYLPKTYEAKGFRLWPLENLLKLKNTSPAG